jgi:hypothetical protein
MRRTALATLTLTAAAAGLTGCLADEDRTDATSKGPFAGLSGGQILDQAARATTDAPSLQVSGQAPDIRTGDTIHFDMALSGKDECSGTLRYTEGKADVIQADGTVYVRYDKKLLHAQNEGASTEEMDAVVDQLAGKWLKASVETPTIDELTRFCDLEKTLGDRHVRSNATRGKTTTIKDTPAIALREKNGDEQITAYVAARGTPYILQVNSYSGFGQSTYLFSDFGKAAAAPRPEGDIIDTTTLFE